MMETTPSSYPHGQFAVGSKEGMGTKHYGCFSPRAGDSLLSFPALASVSSTTEGGAIAAAVAPMLEIMPELRELLCEPYFAFVSGAYEGGLIGDHELI
jgi:hypothetical protein